MRTLVILRALLPLVVSLLRDRRRWLVVGAPLARDAAFHRRRADRLVAVLARLGPTFVKLAQVFAGRVDLIPEPYVGALATLTDRVPPVPLADVEREIEASYGHAPRALFERWDEAPIAAASLGQVHRARWRGEEVVVKVLRPGVEALVAADVAAARRILAVVEPRLRSPHLRGLRTVVDEFARRIADEMDFRLEAEHADRIRANFAGNARVRVPRVVAELTRRRVLVLEYMEGTKIDALDARISSGALEPGAVVRTVMELYIQMMLIDGLFHADPHPGNLLVAPDGAIVLLDFGMVVPVPRETRWHLVSTVFAAIRQDTDGVLAGFRALGLVSPEAADDAAFRELAGTLLALAQRRTTARERMQILLADEVMATLYDWPVLLPSDMVYFARTAALIEGLGTRYDPRFNAIAFASPIALRLRRRILASLGGVPAPPLDLPTAVGAALGRMAGIVSRAGREIAGLVRDQLALAAAQGAAAGASAATISSTVARAVRPTPISVAEAKPVQSP